MNQIGGRYSQKMVEVFIDCYKKFLDNCSKESQAKLLFMSVYECRLEKSTPLGSEKVIRCKPLLINKQSQKEGSKMYNEFFDFNQLYIINSPRRIQELFQRYGAVELRPYSGEKVLVIGCGNRRLSDDGQVSFWGNSKKQNVTKLIGRKYKETNFIRESTDIDRIDFNEQSYNRLHHHMGEYTVDIDASANPSVLIDLSQNKLGWIPDGSFAHFYMEGGPELLDDEHFIEEIIRLLGLDPKATTSGPGHKLRPAEEIAEREFMRQTLLGLEEDAKHEYEEKIKDEIKEIIVDDKDERLSSYMHMYKSESESESES